MRCLMLLMLLTGGTAAATDLQSRVDAYLQPYLDTHNFQGVVLVAKGDRVLVEKGYGMASLELGVPNSPETVFHIASVSKPFTSAAILALVEDGKLDLQAPLNRIIPEYRHADGLTVHHLLAHTSGIPNINGFDEYDEIQRHAQTPESLLGYFKDAPLEFEPGSRFRYSNSNYNLLALIIESISGKPFGAFLKNRVLKPGDTQSAAHDGDATAITPHRADGYAPDGLFQLRRAPWLDWTAKTGNGSMVATARDLYKWTQALFNDQVVSKQSRELLLTEHTPNVGYGWFIRPRHNKRQYHINGRSPGFSSYLGYYPDDDVTVVVLTNLYNSITTSVGTDLAAMVFQLPYQVPSVNVEPLSDTVAAGVPGRFQYGDDFYNPNVIVTLELRDGHVFQVWGDGQLESALIPQGNDEFIDRAFWSEVELKRDDHGIVMEVLFDGFSGRRIQ